MKKWLFGICLFSFGLIYFFFDPRKYAFPKCPFFVISGFKCPGCGSQRAIYSLLHLEIIQAIQQNAFFVFSLPIIPVLIYAEIRRNTNNKLYVLVNNKLYIYWYLSLTLIWWVIRNFMNV